MSVCESFRGTEIKVNNTGKITPYRTNRWVARHSENNGSVCAGRHDLLDNRFRGRDVRETA